jgi:tRNA-dihydrouridine synthase B
MMRTYYAMLVDRGEDDCSGKMKQFATYFTHGVQGGAKLRGAIYPLHEPRAIIDVVDAFFDAAPALEEIAC